MKGSSIWVVCCLAAFSPRAEAGVAERAYFAGVVVRTDRTTQATRLSGGMRFGRLAFGLVLDPLGYRHTGEQSDTDAFVEVDVAGPLAVLGGWRVGISPVLGSRYWQHRPLAGVSVRLPSLVWGNLQLRVAGEVSTPVVEYGDDLPTMTVQGGPAWSLFLRAELTRGL